MVGRNTQTLICGQGSSQGSQEEDVISQLPDQLISDILYHLHTKEVVTTSLLSTRWRNLWKLVPGLDLDTCKFPNFNALASFAHRFFSFHMETEITRLRLRISARDYHHHKSNDENYVPLWIEAALTRHRTQHLDVYFGYYYPSNKVEIPLSVFTCERLVHLRLFGAHLFNAESVSLPCLKIIHLEYVRAPNEATLEKLISGSPVLEDLTIIRCNDRYADNAKVLQVGSQTVKRIDIDQFAQLVISDAPLLQFFRVRVYLKETFKIIINSGFSAKVDVDLSAGCEFNPLISTVGDLLTGISTVGGDLVLSRDICKVMYQYSKIEQLPQFGLLSSLCVSLLASDLTWLPEILENCPKLKSLFLVWYGNSEMVPDDEMSEISLPPMIECLLSSLEFVDIKTRVSGDDTEMKLVWYFLVNSLILKKLTVRLDSHPTKDDISEEILGFPRRSITCEVIVL
ncbi:unnamed protein product [Microthlaspi erraticum]|uniref:F-box domain-containing protein n=1 Tax=Microthlaspi erraticum TaxID=1685480 RepID=A0A6D2IQI4_9BRAS|nr:unnamed protein product [Microthlaspi erraticum]